jgi:hypothetical protein
MPTNLPSNHSPQSQRNVFARQSNTPNEQRTRGVVMQDKGSPKVQRVASKQPDPRKTSHRAEVVNTDFSRSQNSSTGTWRAVKATTWLNPRVKNELERTAESWGMSLSKVVATALEQWVHQHIHQQHEDLLYPKLRQIIREERQASDNRIVFFLMRIAFAAEQSRILITNVLHRLLRLLIKEPKEVEQTFTNLVDQSSSMARRNILQKTPQIKSLLEAWQASYKDTREEGNNKHNG